MFVKTLRGLMFAAVVMLAAGANLAPAMADAGKRSAVDLLFESKHLELLNKGTEASYRIQRTVSDAKMLGDPFSDDIKIGVNAVDVEGKRDVVIKIFTGERARDPRVETGMTGNPILVFFLDRAVSNFALVGGGNRNYLKQQFRDALRDKADIQKTTVEFGGKSVDAYRVSVAPYVEDKNARRMLGYETSIFTFVVSEAIPGYFVELVSTFASALPDTPKFEERITLEGVGAVK